MACARQEDLAPYTLEASIEKLRGLANDKIGKGKTPK
jgi:hypothetical protein